MIIFGKGGHARVVADAVRHNHPDEEFSFIDEGTPEFQNHYEGCPVFVAIGDNKVRERISAMNFNFEFIIKHPCAVIPAHVQSHCRNTFFGAFSFVGYGCKVGNFSIINTGVVLEHDSEVGNFTHLAPCVVTGGRVKIGNRCFIGAGAIIRDGVTIGDDSVVGMGSVVVSHVLAGSTVFGNPATLRPLKFTGYTLQ